MIGEKTSSSRDVPWFHLATEKHLVPVPVVKQHSSGHVIATAEWPYPDRPGSRIIMSMSDKTIHVYDSESLTKCRVMKSPLGDSSASAMCLIEGATIVSGGENGYLALSNLVTNCEPTRIKAHKNCIASLDFWRGYVVSVSRSGEIQVFRFFEGTLKLIGPHAKLEYVPVAVKLVPISNHIRVLVARQNSSIFELYAIGSMTLELSVDMFEGNVVPSPFCLEAIVLNESRTHYAGLTSANNKARITTGSFNSTIAWGSFDVQAWYGKRLKPKLAWSLSGTHVYLSDYMGEVYCVRITDGATDAKLCLGGKAESFMQVCHGEDGRELLIAGKYNYFAGFVLKM